MHITISELIVWLVVGALAGSLTGMVVTRKKGGFGRYINLGIGLVGALIGGIVFDLFKIDLGLGSLAVTFEDLLSAFIGSLFFLAVLWFIIRSRKKKKEHKILTDAKS
jgi:uncharacterized membrane protein YeaQ/YmgE (transglycosylase-associated protein family)